MKRFLYFIAIGIALIACTPNADLGTPFHKGQEVTLSASMPYNNSGEQLPDKQRVSGLDSHPMTSEGAINLYWNNGDQVMVEVGEEEATFTIISGAGTGNATFEGQMPASGINYHVHYPIGYHDSLLSHQTYVENGFGDGLMKMSTRDPGTLDGGFTLHADNALLGLQFTGDAVISKIMVTNLQTKATYTLDCSNQVVSIAGGRLFYIVVPAGEWSDGMKVEVYNATGVVIESRTKAGEIEFTAANALMMAPLHLQDINCKVIDGLFKMVFVEGGTFTMGKGKDAHQVTLSDYYMSECELTQAQWEAVMGEIPQNGFYRIEKYGDNYPMSGISLLECQEFVDKLNAMTGLHFRIPTEAEWEYAARGGKKSKGYIYAGSNDINEVAIYAGTVRRDENGAVIYAPEPVMTRKPNELGIYDMSGNLSEWVTDWNGAFNLYPQLNPTGTAAYSDKSNPCIIRGGCWTYAATNCQSTSRKPFPNHGANGIGLRLVLSDEEPFKMVYVDDTTRIVLRPVKGGTFWMGSNASDAEYDEKPVHEVTLSDFYVGETEVTQQLWQLVMGTNPSRHKGAILPVESVTWDECQVFVEKLSDMTGLPFRLPTEAEWEYAARGGQMSQGYTYAGSNAIDNVAWYHKNCASPQPVGLKAPNELGIYDMSGNVWEKCSDWYGPYTEEKQTNPKGPNSSSNNCRVTRGGSWKDQEEYTWQICCRTVNRGYQSISDRSDFKGLRIVMGTKHTGN